MRGRGTEPAVDSACGGLLRRFEAGHALVVGHGQQLDRVGSLDQVEQRRELGVERLPRASVCEKYRRTNAARPLPALSS
jgi:hypothetical protein